MATSSRVEKTSTGLAFFGDIDHQSIPELMQHMPAFNASSTLLDLSASGKIDSAGLAFMMDWGNRHLSPGQKISVRGASPQLQQLIQIMRLESVFELQL
jgi:anti-anti-sigma factor